MNGTVGANATTYGWVPQTNGRGTMDIIYTCGLTIFLCCWTSLCVNVPAIGDSAWDRFRDKINLCCLGILGPDFLLILAIGQWDSARRSRKKFRDANLDDWTMTHAFFADMGGFVLKTPDQSPFPIDAEQLYYLVTKGYLKYPALERSFIEDKNKSDGLARFITIIQVLIFVITCIARFVQHLAITTLELTTLAFVFAMLCTSICWHYKPRDIGCPYILEIDVKIEDILNDAGDAGTKPWKRTPLDFISRREWFISIIWAYYTEMLRKMHISISRRLDVRPANRIPSDNFPAPTLLVEMACGGTMILYSAIFMSGWVFSFPSSTEGLLWKISSIFTLAFTMLGGAFYFYSDLAFLRNNGTEDLIIQQNDQTSSKKSKKFTDRIKRVLEGIRNISPDKDPYLQVPIRVLFPCIILSVTYALARAYILVEDLIGLRSLPSNCYILVYVFVFVGELRGANFARSFYTCEVYRNHLDGSRRKGSTGHVR